MRSRARAESPRARGGAGRRAGSRRGTSAATMNRRRSRASSIAGRRNEISPRRCPVDWPTRYGIRQKTTPPRSAARAGDAERAQPPAREPPASTNESRTTRSYAQTFPNGSAERPVREAEQPALEVRRRLCLGRERVRVGKRRGAPRRAGGRRARTPSRAGGGRPRPPRRAPPRAAPGSGVVDVADAGHVAQSGARGVEPEADEDEARTRRTRGSRPYPVACRLPSAQEQRAQHQPERLACSSDAAPATPGRRDACVATRAEEPPGRRCIAFVENEEAS